MHLKLQTQILRHKNQSGLHVSMQDLVHGIQIIHCFSWVVMVPTSRKFKNWNTMG